MIRRLAHLGTAALGAGALLPVALLAQGFEGVVHARMTGSSGEATEITYSVKGALTRMDVAGSHGGGGAIYDADHGTMTSILPSRKQYVVMDLKAMQAMRGDEHDHDMPTITATGRRETVAGHGCEHYTVTGKSGDKTDVCVATDMGYIMGAGGRGSGFFGGRGFAGEGSEMAQLRSRFPHGFFPLKWSSSQGSGGEVTSIERKSLPASEFEPPAGYTKLDMGAMMRGMRPPQRP